MTRTLRRYGADIAVTVAVLFATGIGGTARAQEVTSFDRVAARVKLGATIRVTGLDGHTTEGTLTELSASSLRIRAAGTSTDFRAGEIRSIYRQKPKPWRRDVLIGLGAGAAFGLAASIGDRPLYLEGSLFTVMYTVSWAGLGAGVGALFAAGTPEKSIPVYELKTASSHVRLGVAPIATPGRQGVTLTLRF